MHSLAVVIGPTPLAQFDRFDENMEVDDYIVGDVAEWEKKRIVEYYNSRPEIVEAHGGPYTSFEECYSDKGEDWNGNAFRKDSNGVWHEYRTSNPEGRYDWYAVGGRWSGHLKLKESAVAPVPRSAFEYPWNNDKHLSASSIEHIRKVRKGGYADSARLGDIENPGDIVAGAVVIDGEWYDNEGSDGYFKPIREYVEGLSDDVLITCIDYHM